MNYWSPRPSAVFRPLYQLYHATKRAKERYGIDFTPAKNMQIVRMIQGGQIISKEVGQSIYILEFEGQPVKVAYNKAKKTVVSFLPLVDDRPAPEPPPPPPKYDGFTDEEGDAIIASIYAGAAIGNRKVSNTRKMYLLEFRGDWIAVEWAHGTSKLRRLDMPDEVCATPDTVLARIAEMRR